MQTAIIKLPDTGSVESREFLDFEEAEVLDTEVSTLIIVLKHQKKYPYSLAYRILVRR